MVRPLIIIAMINRIGSNIELGMIFYKVWPAVLQDRISVKKDVDISTSFLSFSTKLYSCLLPSTLLIYLKYGKSLVVIFY